MTFAAIATPAGEGAISIIRISGHKALSIANRIFSKDVFSFKSHTVHYGHILNGEEKIDEVLLLVMRSPKSYTGEDMVEIFCHGGSFITQKVLNTILKAGAEPAKPGAFTHRAFLNGKIDLSQAEAVQELISAKSNYALKAASKQLEGALSKKITAFQDRLIQIAAILEAWVDFPEEGLEFASKEEIFVSLSSIYSEINHLCMHFHEGKKLSTGISLCLLGAPNVGKSSLMNALIGKNRAIVTDIPGTTRDFLEEELLLGNFHFHLFDTAGIHASKDFIEIEGMKRSQKVAEEADLILFLLDATRGMSAHEKILLASLPSSKTLLIWNKIDLHHAPQPSLQISAKTLQGIEDLKKAILDHALKTASPHEEVIITKERHYHCLLKALEGIKRVIDGLQTSISPEFLTADIRFSLEYLGQILGRNISEDILSAIFSTFCVGK